MQRLFCGKNGKEHEESQEHEEYRGDGGSAEVKRNTRDSEILSAAIPDSLNLSNKAAGYRYRPLMIYRPGVERGNSVGDGSPIGPDLF